MSRLHLEAKISFHFEILIHLNDFFDSQDSDQNEAQGDLSLCWAHIKYIS